MENKMNDMYFHVTHEWELISTEDPIMDNSRDRSQLDSLCLFVDMTIEDTEVFIKDRHQFLVDNLIIEKEDNQ